MQIKANCDIVRAFSMNVAADYDLRVVNDNALELYIHLSRLRLKILCPEQRQSQQ